MTDAAEARLTHAAFREAYAAGRLRIEIDPKRAARFVSARLLLPLVMLPVLGIGVGLALMGWIWTGLAIVAAAIVVPRVVKRSAPHFIVTQSLAEERFYDDAVREGVLRVAQRAEP